MGGSRPWAGFTPPSKLPGTILLFSNPTIEATESATGTIEALPGSHQLINSYTPPAQPHPAANYQYNSGNERRKRYPKKEEQ